MNGKPGTPAAPPTIPDPPAATSAAPRPMHAGYPFTSGPGKPLTRRAKVARAIAAAASWLLKLSRLGVAQARSRGEKALDTFAQQPIYTRQRVYAFGSYGAAAALTLAAQLWEPNSLQAYVKVEPVALPEATVIFVRNDSAKLWKDVKVTLNGRYNYQRMDLPPTRYIALPVDRFATFDANGKATYAAKETVPRLISVDCEQGHFELDLEAQR
jgi:hypothetical protein